MSRTYKTDHWDVRLKAARGEDDWKRELREELEEMSGVTVYLYVIMNEWTPTGSGYELQEIVGNRYFESQNEAWEALNLIAEEHNVELHPEATAFELNEIPNYITYETYYIQELVNG